MNREIKFRGKRIDNGEWAEGDLVRHYENQRRFIACDQLAYTHTECGIGRLVSERYHEVDPATIGQYTGLKDKNGVEIYELDKVRVEGRWPDYVVRFYNGSFYVCHMSSADPEGVYWKPLGHFEEAVEVIGNIYEEVTR